MTLEALVRDLGSMWSERRRQAMSQLVDCGEPAVPELIRLARRRWGRAPGLAIETLGLIGDPRACEVIRAAIDSRTPRILLAAIVAAGRLRDAEAVPTLCGLCVMPRGDGGRCLASWALGEIDNPRALHTLLQLMCEGTQGERAAAHLSAAKISRQCPEVLARHLGSQPVGAMAAGVLCDLGKAAIPALKLVAGSGSGLAALRAQALLGSMGLATSEHRDALIAELEDRDATFRTAAVSGLAHLAKESRDPHLRGLLPKLRQWERSSGSPLERRYYRQAIAAIDGATAHLKELPLPVDIGADVTESLPLPATAGEAQAEPLPVPAEDRSYPPA